MIYYRNSALKQGGIKQEWDGTEKEMERFAKKCAKEIGKPTLPLRKASHSVLGVYI